jgi:hypothetical protein
MRSVAEFKDKSIEQHLRPRPAPTLEFCIGDEAPSEGIAQM